MDALTDLARHHHLRLIEDACEAIGAKFDGQRAGSFGDLAIFGFYPNKQITTGEGGAVLARDPGHAAHLRALRNQGRGPQRQVFVDGVESRGPQRQVFVDGVEGRGGPNWLDHAEQGYNYRLSELACALGRVQLSRLDEILPLRQAAAQRYDALLGSLPGLELPPLSLPRRAISWFVYVARLPQQADPDQTLAFRDQVQAVLAQRGIASGRYFAPIHQQPSQSRAVSLPLTESIARRTLALPFFNRITAEQQAEVAEGIREALQR
jgi:perosamine synthetase